MVIQQETGLGPSTRSAIINGANSGFGIAPYTSYTCKVTAYTIPGKGEPAFVTALSAQAGKW